MSRVSMYVFSLIAAGAASVSPAFGQAVISTHSGLVHFFEGAVFVAGQPLESHFGKFAAIPEGAELRTEQGRAEILLTPGVFLRVGEKSSIRMVSTVLANTKVELLTGSAMVESAEAAPGTSVTMIYKNWTVRQAREGSYRVDADPPRVQARGGTVEVAAAGDAPVTVEQGNDLPLEGVLAPEKSAIDAPDSLRDWAEGRAQSISADNAIAADIQDPPPLRALTRPWTPSRISHCWDIRRWLRRLALMAECRRTSRACMGLPCISPASIRFTCRATGTGHCYWGCHRSGQGIRPMRRSGSAPGWGLA